VQPLPGKPAKPPDTSAAEAIDGDRVELQRTALELWRGKKLMMSEPLTEAYAMAVLPARRMVAIHRANFELCPTLDIFWVRPLQRKAKAGQGAASWVSFRVDGRRLQLRSTDDGLFVDDGSGWIEIDAEPLTSVPSWIASRGWL
jgi:hypothetical protein